MVCLMRKSICCAAERDYGKSAARLTKELVRIPSVSGDEKHVGEFICRRLRRNFSVERQLVRDSFNVFASAGTPKILFTTHMDTVPGVLKVYDDGKKVYGRGACDAKGIAACMIIACEEAKKEGYTDYGMLFDVSEETGLKGVQKALKRVKAKFVVLGEPTSLKIVNGHRGILYLHIETRGKAAHSSTLTPESAIPPLLNCLERLRSIKLPKSRRLGKTTMNIGAIRAGAAVNVVAKEAAADVEFRTTVQNRMLMREITGCLAGKKVRVELRCDFNPVISAWRPDIGIAQKPEYVPYFTELLFYNERAKAVVFGPGDIEFAHSDRERVKISDLDTAVKVYIRFIKRYAHRR
jgi:acetylornithine deacetylase